MKNCMAVAMIVSTTSWALPVAFQHFITHIQTAVCVVPYVTFGTFCPLSPHKHLWHPADTVDLKRVHCYNPLQCPSNFLDGERHLWER